MADIVTDPLSAVYETLWLLLTDSTDFAVKPGNQIRYVGKRNPEKDSAITEDFPEVRIVAGGITPHLQNTSNSSRLTMRLNIEVRSGDKDLSEAHYPLIWAVYRAMAGWAARLRALTWEGNTFVVLGRPIGDITEGIERGEVSRGVSGFYAIWVVEIDLWFATSDL